MRGAMGRGAGAALATLLTAAVAGPLAAQQTGDFAFVDVNVVPMDEERVLERQTVVVSDGRITAIRPVDEVDIPSGAARISGEGLYLMPGLAEMHAHIPGANAPAAYLENTLFLYVANGITTIRGMLGEPSHLALRARAESGALVSPRIYTSGPSFNGNSVRSPSHAAEMVREQSAAGYDFLKLHPGLTMAAFDSIDATADARGIEFAGHVSADVGLARTLEAEQATIDHLDGYVEAMAAHMDQPSQFFGLNLAAYADESEMPRLARETAAAGVWNVPTMALFPPRLMPAEELLEWPEVRYVPPQQASSWAGAVRSGQQSPLFSPENGAALLELRRRVLLELHRAGAGILLGSDAPQVFNVPGFAMHRELAEYVTAGLSPYEALRTGSVAVAEFYGVLDERGTVEEGKVADLMLVRGNPLDDVANVRDPAGVMLRGRWLSGEEIDRRLEAIAAGYGN